MWHVIVIHFLLPVLTLILRRLLRQLNRAMAPVGAASLLGGSPRRSCLPLTAWRAPVYGSNGHGGGAWFFF